MKKFIFIIFFLFAFSLVFRVEKIFAAYCPNGWCEAGEDCNSCFDDCHPCPTSVPPPPQQCTRALCGILAGCNCYENPRVCETCSGYQQCSCDTCLSGRGYCTYCTPNCTNPDRCYDTPACDDNPVNCNDLGGNAFCQSLVVPASCGGSPSCGVGICASGGNCYTDCSGCSSPKHLACSGCSCNLVNGVGSNTCANPCDCGCCSTHHECQNYACVGVPEAIFSTCLNNIDCSIAPTCTITGPSSLIAGGAGGSYTATATGHGGTVRRIEIWRAQENYMIQDRPATGWRLIGSAATNASGLTSTTQSWSATSSDLTGYNGNKWWVVCNAYYNINGFVAGNKTQQCTGSPWDPFTSWSDCWSGNGTDSKEVQVNAVPTPTPTPTCAPPVAPQCGSATVVDDDVTLTWGEPSNWEDLCESPSGRRYRVYNSQSTVYPPGTLIGDFLYDTSPTSSYNTRSMILTDQVGGGYYWGVTASNSLFTSIMGYICDYSISYARDPWWQTQDGDIHAQGTINSTIPSCASSTVLSKNGTGADGTPGVVSWGGGGNIGIGQGSVSSANWQAGTSNDSTQITYDYMKNRLNIDETITLNTCVASDCSIPDVSGTYFLNNSGSSNNLARRTITAGEKVIIFASGGINVTSNITVAQGGFFALITKGGIIFSSDVTNAQGFFLSDSTITIEGTGGNADAAFSGGGSFVGWGGVTFNRSLPDNCLPAETFVSRPDLYLNSPESFKFTRFVFQELAP